MEVILNASRLTSDVFVTCPPRQRSVKEPWVTGDVLRDGDDFRSLTRNPSRLTGFPVVYTVSSFFSFANSLIRSSLKGWSLKSFFAVGAVVFFPVKGILAAMRKS